MRCISCSKPLSPKELFRKVELEDGSFKEILDDFCNTCLNSYVKNIDNLDSREYAFEHVTEYDFSGRSDFAKYSE